ncbi:MAG: helix-turn-helix transcriptional regulator [Thermoleophilia bacterium]|nr:helix-turn-helix transcriptional regulator [Thermoleophilia bacterium]
MSQDHLARATGLTSRTIGRIERDESSSRGSLALIAMALDVPVTLLHAPEVAKTSNTGGLSDGEAAA